MSWEDFDKFEEIVHKKWGTFTIPSKAKAKRLKVLNQRIKKGISIGQFPGIIFIKEGGNVTAVATCCYVIRNRQIDRDDSGSVPLEQAAHWAASHKCTSVKDVNTAYKMILLLSGTGINFNDVRYTDLEWIESNDPKILAPVLEHYGLTYQEWVLMNAEDETRRKSKEGWGYEAPEEDLLESIPDWVDN
jgi:hypothetical protein